MNEKEIKDLLNTIEDQIPYDYCRSYDSVDGLCHTWLDEDSWQYKALEYIKQLQQENQQLKEQLQQKGMKVNNIGFVPFKKKNWGEDVLEIIEKSE